MSNPAEPRTLAELTHVGFRVGKILSIFPDSNHGFHGLLTIYPAAQKLLANGLAHQFGNGRPRLTCPNVECLPSIVF